MQLENALDVLTGGLAVSVTTESLNEATKVLQGVDDETAVNALARIAFDVGQSLSRRDAAFVLLRSSLLAWKPSTNSVSQHLVEENIVPCFIDSSDHTLRWRIANCISAIFSGIEDDSACQWLSLQAQVADLLSRRHECLEPPLQLIKAFYADGLPKQLMGETISPHVSTILKEGLQLKQGPTAKLAFQASAAVIERYNKVTSQVTPESSALFKHLLELAHTLMLENGDVVDLLTTLACIADAVNSRNLRNLWDSEAAGLLTALLGAGHVKLWAASPLETRIAASKLTQSLCQLSASAIMSTDKNILGLVPWEFLVDHLQHQDSNVDTQSIMDWELSRDDEDFIFELDMANSTVDCTLAAWEQLDRLLSSKAGVPEMVTLTLETAQGLSRKAEAGSQFASWMLLMILLGTKTANVEHQRLAFAFSSWERAIQVRDDRDPLGSAKIRWAALSFITEAVEAAVASLDNVLDLLGLLIRTAQIEKVPRVKAKCFVAFCQLVETIEDEAMAKTQAIQLVLQRSVKEWLLPCLLDPQELLPQISLVNIPFNHGPEFWGMAAYLKELAMASIALCLPKLGTELIDVYVPVFEYAKAALDRIPQDPRASDIAEGALDLASRCLECVGVCLLTSDQSIGVFSRCVEDAHYVLDKIIQFDNLHLKELGPSKANLKSGIHAQGFERTMLQAAARALPCGSGAKLGECANGILAIVIRKLCAVDTITVVDQITSSPEPLQGGIEGVISPDSRYTTLVLTQPKGQQKTVNINTIASLCFVGVSCSILWPLLSQEDSDKLILLICVLTRSSPLAMVRKSGMEALQHVCEYYAGKCLGSSKRLFEENRGYVKDPNSLMNNPDFKSEVTVYLNHLRTILQVAATILNKSKADCTEEILYILADACDGARDLALIFSRPLTDAHWSGLDTSFQQTVESLFAQIAVTLTDIDQSEESSDFDPFGLCCDAAMQFTSRLAKVFNVHLKTLFASVIAVEDVSVVARTAALCVFANYIEAMGNAAAPAGCSLPAAEILPVALLYCRPLPMSDQLRTAVKALVPQFSAGRPNPKAIDEDFLLAEAAKRMGAPVSAVVDSLEPYNGEVMKLQAASYCVGAACANLASEDHIFETLPSIDEAFVNLLDHPLATLSNRRVIVDCVGCATLKIFQRVGNTEKMGSLNLKLFSAEGLLRLLNLVFPLLDDNEDACAAHDILINWVLEGPRGCLPPINDENGVPINASGQPSIASNLKRELARILSELAGDETENLLSVSADNGGRLSQALQLILD